MSRERAFLVAFAAFSSYCVPANAFVIRSIAAPAPVFDRQLKVKAIERLILSKLGLQEPPVVSEEQIKSVDASSLLKYKLASDMTDRMMADKARKTEAEDQYYISKMSTISVKELEVSSTLCNFKHQSKFYEIDIGDLPSNATAVTSARFQIYYEPSKTTTTEEILLSVYQLTESCCLSKYPDTILLDTRKATSDHACFIEFDITNAVKSWAADGSSYHGLEVEISAGQCAQQSSYQVEYSSQFSSYVTTSKTDVVDYRPVLFVSSSHPMSSDAGRRRRQSIDLEYCNSLDPNQPNCCVHDFSVNFKDDLGWDWIIQPKEIASNQCTGECPDTWAQDSSYAQVLSEYYLLNPGGSVAPCCSPRTYSDLEILYFDGVNPGAQMGVLSDMIVTSCECA
ncbi:transforming growth factor beta-2 proprotein-like [Corticium candelabrum]|uniref:transforming growth factor beta-2 proprotein-like n=1 Tax=Corticium candelabrum TaxID=121492 RepID=UPI002E253E45|nr:transforming growth factor beta-2 proprotein-like [Corticium candelabrum]